MAGNARAWKDHKRRTAKVLGGQRLGVTGAANPDVIAGDMCIECKQRNALPAWITGALAKVRAQAGPQRVGMVVLHEKGRRDSLVVMALSDFVARYGAIPSKE